MAKSSRFKSYRQNASKGHQLVGEILQRLFPLGKVYQEYPLDRILKKGYRDQNIAEEHQDKFMMRRAAQLHADWVVLDRCLVVEFHGEHHFQAVDYGDGKGEENFQHRLHLDKVKRSIVNEAGFILIEWPYNEELTDDSFAKKLEEVL